MKKTIKAKDILRTKRAVAIDKEKLPDEIFESKRVQLTQLQSRIALHGSRMWQLPLTYLGSIALALTACGSAEFNLNWCSLFFFLSLLGGIFLYCLYGAHEGYKRTSRALNDVEESLGLVKWSMCHHSHTIPYWIMTIFGIVVCLSISVYTKLNPVAFQ